MIKYGQRPKSFGRLDLLDKPEMMFVMYMPIIVENKLFIPENLKPFLNLIDIVLKNEYIKDKNVYITAKHLYVTKDNPGNRPGWHSDGFGTEDINYIWCDKYPTEFCIQDFNLSNDCEKSMIEMEQQVRKENCCFYEEKELLRLDQSVIHRTPVIETSGMRTFVKISISKDKYNLIGNAKNPGLSYSWEMLERKETRNHPHG